MEIVFGSRHLSTEVVTALDVCGREHLVIVTKASWSIPSPGQRPRPLTPTPLVHADEFYGEPGESAIRYGSDFPRFKPRCDVLFDASAQAPDGKPVTELVAGFKLGTLQKGVKVIGPRTWSRFMGVSSTTKPRPFVRMPLHYGMAFGGTRTYEVLRGGRVQTLAEALLSNPAGIGWAGSNTGGDVDGTPAPSLEAVDDPVTRPTGRHAPMAFSAVARHWHPRTEYTGTYDAQWERDVCPFLPEDFDEQYHQCAPRDQQIAYPRGGDEVILLNMLQGRPHLRFKLPRLDRMSVRVLRTDYSTATPTPVVDTLFFEPDAEAGPRFSAVWRTSMPIKRRIQEFKTVAVGPIDMAWWTAKSLGLDGSGCVGCGSTAVAAPW